MSWNSFCSNFMAFSFQNLSVCTELQSRCSELISLAYLSKLLRILMLFSNTVPVLLMLSISDSSLMLPFRRVSMIFSSFPSIRSSKQIWFFSTFLKIMKATLVSFYRESFCRIEHTLLRTANLGTAKNFSMAISTNDNSQTFRRV